ncbi:MAG: PAS domain-containing protein, partial [Rhodospirillales bacterium]|nr:PAS domain-containing protein [Rhodospirillales bacterium]
MSTQPSTPSDRKTTASPPLDASVLDGFSDPVLLVDPEHTIVDYNRAARHMLGAGALGSRLDQFLNSDHIRAEIDARLAGTPATRSEVFLPHPVARYFELNVWRLPDLTSSGPAWAMLVLRDITESKKTAKM